MDPEQAFLGSGILNGEDSLLYAPPAAFIPQHHRNTVPTSVWRLDAIPGGKPSKPSKPKELSTPEMIPVGLLDDELPPPFPEEYGGALPPASNHSGSPGGYSMHSTPSRVHVMDASAPPFTPQGLAVMHRPIDEIRGNIVRLSKDQEGSRMVQRILDLGVTDYETEVLLEEMIPAAVDLISDVFGNYVIQRLFDILSTKHRKILLEVMRGHIPSLALQTYGCRVIQKALEIADEEDRDMVSHELDGHVARCVQDQNGNHVIQKCIECMPHKVDFIARAFLGKIQEIATHAYGCRVLQRLLEHCHHFEKEPILEEILTIVDTLVVDQYGNYVVQYLILNGLHAYQQRLISKLIPQMLTLSRHKYASNVAEKMIERSDNLEAIVRHVVSQLPLPDSCSVLVAMIRDQYANYVVQKLLDCCTAGQRKTLVEHIKPHVASLRRYTYGKHIIARLEKLGTLQRQQGSGGGDKGGGGGGYSNNSHAASPNRSSNNNHRDREYQPASPPSNSGQRDSHSHNHHHHGGGRSPNYHGGHNNDRRGHGGGHYE